MRRSGTTVGGTARHRAQRRQRRCRSATWLTPDGPAELRSSREEFCQFFITNCRSLQPPAAKRRLADEFEANVERILDPPCSEAQPSESCGDDEYEPIQSRFGA
eukprot:scaffold4605_cov124-Pinguiococcus_pyrenoidosus.AAC.1